MAAVTTARISPGASLLLSASSSGMCWRPLHAPVRHRSTAALRVFADCAGEIVNKYTIPDRMPSPFSAAGRKAWMDRAKNVVSSTMAVSSVKKDIRDYKANQFPVEAEKIYIAMNEHFASGKPSDLEPLVTSQMLSTLKNQMKARTNTFQWRHIQSLARPTTEVVGYYKGAAESHNIIQITGLRVLDKSGRVLTDKEQDVTEHVVFERWAKSESSRWRIAGKIEPSSM
ncbi:39S ribosomal protein L45, mitochondrial [Sorochytrium milnesiophthora]